MIRSVQNPGQRISADQAAALVQSGMWLDYGAVLCQPDAFDAALAQRRDPLDKVKIRSCLSSRPRAIMGADPDGTRSSGFPPISAAPTARCMMRASRITCP
jgi:acyl-CoA hydrolase